MQATQLRNLVPNQSQPETLVSQVDAYWQNEPRPNLNRASKDGAAFFRCGRYFTVGHEWYASLREDRDVGPYATREGAEMALASHLTACCLESFGSIQQIGSRDDRDPTVLELLVQELASCREHCRVRSENSAYAWAQQRLTAFDEHPDEHDHVKIRARALRHFMRELDCCTST